MLLKEVVKKSFWALAAPEVLNILETGREGLAEEEIRERLKLFGKNSIPEKAKAEKIKIFLEQFESPLIFLLLIAGAITAFIKDYNDAVIIFAAAFLNILLGFYQENKAENALSHLKTYIKERVRVIRESREYEIETSELVPGDIVHLSQGNRVPADARLLYLNDFAVDESILTGESLPVFKTVNPVKFEAVIGDQKCMVFSGTLVVQGFANAAVCATGPNTELGRIASLVRDHHSEDETPLKKAIISFSLKASVILIAVSFLVFITGILAGHSPLQMFLTAVAMMVSSVPEGLPVAMTIILAIGVQRLAKKKAVVRKLLAAETLGNTSIILTDKTGTLTEAKMSLADIFVLGENQEQLKEQLLKVAVLNSDVVIENPKDPPAKWQIVGRPLETAVIKSAADFGLLAPKIKKENEVLSFLPFNSLSKYSASVISGDNQTLLTVFGAPEILVKLSSQTSEADQAEYHKAINRMASEGGRILGAAVRELPEKNFSLTANTKIENLKFLGIISFKDPLRPKVHEAIHRTHQAGIKTVILTGDHRGTAEAVAKELGLATGKENVIDGAELESLTESEFKKRLPHLSIVSRVSPEGKVKIVEEYQKIGAVVAMTGDGINDAPSLKKADIGIAMGSGADVAKDVSDLVLLDDNYETIVAAVAEGRRIMENIRKVIVYLFSSVADELILIGGSLIFGLSLPLTAAQILWVNLVTESLPSIALAFEDHFDYLLIKPRNLSKSLLDKEMRFLILAIGLPTSCLLFITYYFLNRWGIDPAIAKTFTFASFGAYSLFLIFSIRNLQKSIFQYNPFSNLYLVASVVAGLAFMALAVYLPFFQELLDTVPLSPLWASGVIAVGIINIIAIEVGKLIIKRL